jgi:hypothetical protein
MKFAMSLGPQGGVSGVGAGRYDIEATDVDFKVPVEVVMSVLVKYVVIDERTVVVLIPRIVIVLITLEVENKVVVESGTVLVTVWSFIVSTTPGMSHRKVTPATHIEPL